MISSSTLMKWPRAGSLIWFIVWYLTSDTLLTVGIFLLSVTVVSWTIYRSFIYPLYLSPLRHIPTVPGCPLWGHTYERLTREVGVPERKWHQQLGPTVRFFLPFGVERISIADEQAIRYIQQRNSYNFIRPKRVIRWMDPILGKRGILLANGALHMKQRKALAPAFSSNSIRRLEHMFWDKGLLLASKLTNMLNRQIDEVDDDRENRRWHSIETLEWLQRAALDLVGIVSFGYDVDSLREMDSPLRHVYASIFALDWKSCMIQTLRLYFNTACFIPCSINRAMESGSGLVNGIAATIIDQKMVDMNTTLTSKDVIGQVIAQNNRLPEIHSDRLELADIHDDIKTIFGAGHDTTAIAIGWTLDQLSKHPKIQERLREEILTAIPMLHEPDCDPFSLAKINVDSLTYLNKVCRESLRYIPPIPTVSREVHEDTQLGGYFIPAGTSLHVTPNAINHLPCYWGHDADTFNPDRWDGLPKEWRPIAYQPFLSGPRGCIGRRFAETEMKIFLCCLLARFEFAPDEKLADQEKHKKWRLVLRPRDGINLKMRLLV